MRLPARVNLPFGYDIQVRQVSDAEMRTQNDDGELSDGLWDVETRTIYIRKALSLRRRKYILGHEVTHAVNDWIHSCLDESAMVP